MKIIRFIFGLFLTFCIIFSCFVGVKKINAKNPSLSAKEYQGLITVWNVDCFEGGKGSRRQFLLDVARTVEKNNVGVKIMVVSHTITSVEQGLKEGDLPDVISFGLGVEVENLIPLHIDFPSNGGTIEDVRYAVPWCRGGYLLITKSDSGIDLYDNNFDNIIVSQGEYTQPLLAMTLEDIKAKDFSINQPLDAYVQFVSSKKSVFLGTQRDVVRLENRGLEVNTRPLTVYNDLYQYVALTSRDKNKLTMAKRFINQLLSKNVQSKLEQISMMSEIVDVNYDNQHLISMQKNKSFSTLSVFVSTGTLKNCQELSKEAVKGEQTAINKLKKLLV